MYPKGQSGLNNSTKDKLYVYIVGNCCGVSCRFITPRKAQQQASRLPQVTSPPQTNGSVKAPPQSTLQAASSVTSLPSHSLSGTGARNKCTHLKRPGIVAGLERRLNEDGPLSNNQEQVVNLWCTARLEQLRPWIVKVCYLISVVAVRYGLYTILFTYYNKNTHYYSASKNLLYC